MAQSFSVIPPSLKRKRETESEDQNQARKVLVVQDPNKEVQSNSTPKTTSSSSQSGWDYDVFLSFRGQDTRKNFTDHLYTALERLEISTFRDEEKLPRGENISAELLKAIRGSRISIVVFSKGYATSRWCLEELVEIVRCKSTIDHTIFPIFYHVDPSDVRHQKGTFGEAFARHEKRFQTDMDREQRWRKALTEAANCSGWDLNKLADGYESRFIKEIVEQVLCKVKPARLDVAKHPIGMKSHVDRIKGLLNLGKSDVRVVGIYGMGGIGKTTLAKAVYNKICDSFEGKSFISNLKESSEKHGLVHLQEQLLYDILKTNFKIGNVDMGIVQIKEKLHRKSVLIILDDVDDFEKLHMLFDKEWLGLGSRIIVTTRDEHLLKQLGVDEKYKLEELNPQKSLRLFSWHAFKMANPKEDYLELSSEAVDYAEGLPLALVVLGSFLKERSIAEWKSELEKLRRTPNEKIQKILGISFDSLDRDTKEIFLDIACFFAGMDKEYAIKIFDDCNFSPDIGIPILIERSLVTTDCQNKLLMHNLIRDMGREIVCQESPKYPEKRSRLWFREDVLNVLRKHTGSKKVEGLILNPLLLEDLEVLKTKAFKKMTNLRLLQINDVQLAGSYEYLSKELKWLCWHKCPLKSLPQDFQLENLVILDMQHSKVKRVWETNKIFNKMKVLNLSNSKYLTRSPDFLQVPQLEILILEGCTSLVQVHESIGYLKRLVLLNLKNCTNLKHLPRSVVDLESLETLDLFGCLISEKLPNQQPSSFGLWMNLKNASFSRCSSLIELPNFLHAPHLESLNLSDCTSLVEIHESIGFLKRLVSLNLCSCKKIRSLPSSISNLESLEIFNLMGCDNLEKLPENLGKMRALKILRADFTAIKQLPSSLSLLENLVDLSCSYCKHLINSPEFSQISRLKKLNLCGCTSLVKIHESVGHLKRLEVLNLSRWPELDKSPEELGNMKALWKLDADRIGIEQLPPSLGILSNLKVLTSSGCGGPISPKSSNRISFLSNSELCSLIDLCLMECNLSEDAIPIQFGYLSSLQNLSLSRNNFHNLPSCISRLPKLERLFLSECTNLQSISVPRGIRFLAANGCTSLESISILTNDSSESSYLDDLHLHGKTSSYFDLRNCAKLVEIQNLESLRCVPCTVSMEGCYNLSSEFRKSVFQMMSKTGNRVCYVLLPGSENPNWISHQRIGSSISFCVPSLLDGKIRGKMLLCVVYAVKKEAPRDIFAHNQRRDFLWRMRLRNKSYRDRSNNRDDWDTVGTFFTVIPEGPNFDIFEDHIAAQVSFNNRWIRNIKSGDEIEVDVDVQFFAYQGIVSQRIVPQIMEVKRCGIHFVVDEHEPNVRRRRDL